MSFDTREEHSTSGHHQCCRVHAWNDARYVQNTEQKPEPTGITGLFGGPDFFCVGITVHFDVGSFGRLNQAAQNSKHDPHCSIVNGVESAGSFRPSSAKPLDDNMNKTTTTSTQQPHATPQTSEMA